MNEDSMKNAVIAYRDLCVGFTEALQELMENNPDLKKMGMCTLFYSQILDQSLAAGVIGTPKDVLKALGEIVHATTTNKEVDC